LQPTSIVATAIKPRRARTAVPSRGIVPPERAYSRIHTYPS
jgi:hypothetical protein